MVSLSEYLGDTDIPLELVTFWTETRLSSLERRLCVHRERALERGSVSEEIRPEQVALRFIGFANKCAYCGKKRKLQIDHIIPIAKDGPHTLRNLAPACKACNESKSAKPVEEWYPAQPFYDPARHARLKDARKRRLPVEYLFNGTPGIPEVK